MTRILFSLLVLFPVASFCATYYVDATGGLDANNGLTTGTAWQTIAKINGSTFSAGDQILFKRGEVWAERLTVPSSGSAGNVILFSAYGSGALPILEATTGRPEAIVIGTGKTYIKVSFIQMRGGDTGSASALLESDSIDNVIEDCTFDGQDLADSLIGGPSTARRCLLQNARDDGYTLHGTNTGLVENCTFTGNRSAINNSGTAMALTVNDCIFEENGDGSSSSFGDVNGLSVGTFVFNRCDFRGRAAGGPHGFVTGFSSGGVVTMNYCRFDNSTSSSSANGSIDVGAGGSLTLNNCVIVGGLSADRGGVSANTGILNVTNTIFWNIWRLKATAPGEVNLDHCVIFNTGGIDAPGEHVYTVNTSGLTSDPLFFDFATKNFRLTVGSPAIDTGIDLGISLDLDGNSVGNPPDRGAYAYFVAPPDFTGQIRTRKSPIISARRR